MKYVIVFILLIVLPAWVAVVGAYHTIKSRNDGKFKVQIVVPNCVILWYCHRGEWIEDSIHSSVEEANNKIWQYRMAGYEQITRTGNKR